MENDDLKYKVTHFARDKYADNIGVKAIKRLVSLI